MRRFLAGLISVGFISACASRASDALPNPARTMGGAALPLISRVTGCYFLEEGPWQQNAAIDSFIPRAAMPRHFEFEITPLPGADATQNDTFPILRVRTSVARREPYFEYWQPSVNTPTGFHTGILLPTYGAAMELQVTPTGLRGTLVTFSDAVAPNAPPFPSAAVTLRPETCQWKVRAGAF